MNPPAYDNFHGIDRLDSSIAAVLGVAVGGIWRYHERVLGADAPSTAPETRSVTGAATIGFYGPDANQLNATASRVSDTSRTIKGKAIIEALLSSHWD
jgi:hypothetical protein